MVHGKCQKKKEKRQGDPVRKRANVRIWSIGPVCLRVPHVDYIVTGPGSGVDLTPIDNR